MHAWLNWAYWPPMIEPLDGNDADLIIEDRWPHRYDEDKITASALHHRDVVADALNTHAQPHLTVARTEAATVNAGALAHAVTTKTNDHLRATEESARRHCAVAEHLESFASAVVATKNRINGAVQTFTTDWAKAPELAQVNNWYQHDYNAYRAKLVDTGRGTVTAALHDLSAAHDTCFTFLQTALDQ